MLSPRITANGSTIGEMFGRAQSVRDSAFAFLGGTVQVFQAKFPAVREQP